MTTSPARGRRHMRTLMVGPVLMGLIFWGGVARGSNLTALQQEVESIERLARALSINVKSMDVGRDRHAESRLVDAQVLYSLKDYTRAAILLLDYVTRYKNTPDYPEALFYLADSLYLKRDYLGAKRYFEDLVNKVHGKYYQEALQRLVELSLQTGDTSQIDRYLAALASIPPGQLKPSVPYVRAKYFYFRHEIDKSIKYFREIPPGHKYYLYAQYFIGTALVSKKNYAGAVKVYQKLVGTAPRNKAERHIVELAYLALGRLFYEDGKIARAIKMYQKVPRQSSEFDTALYEIAWAHVKNNDYRRALRALELLVLANPNSPFIPQVKVLQGNLLIRLKKWHLATELFSKTRERFMPVYSRMKQVLDEHGDPDVFFDLLLARNVSKFAMKIQVPALALTWVKEKPGIKRAMNLVEDVRGIQDSITDATKLITQLERAVNSPAKIKIFPEFTEAKSRALEVANRMALVRLRLVTEERKLVSDKASGAQKDQIAAFDNQRAALDAQVATLPKRAEDYKVREKLELARIQGMDKELNRLSVTVDSLKAQLVASRTYFLDTSAKRNKGARVSFNKEANQVGALINGLSDQVENLQQEVVSARSAAGIGGPGEVAERKVKRRFQELVSREHRLFTSIRGALGAEEGRQFDALAALMARMDRVRSSLSDFDSRLDKSVERKLVNIRRTLAEERRHVAQFSQSLTDYKQRTDVVAGNLTYSSFQEVVRKFYDIVVQADVGIIDVAWALKDTKSKEVSRLVRQRKADLRMLDDEFKEVLRDD